MVERCNERAIYRVMELIDGYASELPKWKLIDTETGEAINEGIELHDKCVEYLSKRNVSR